jgi:hypothetical protein
MASNNTNASTNTGVATVVIYYPLCLVIFGTIFNSLTFITLCRPLFRDGKKYPAMHYMRAIAIFDILMLYGWNFDHYLSGAHGFSLLAYSIVSCKFFTFLNYFAAQTSAWLRVFVSFDRYVLLNHRNLAWFSKSKNVLIIIGCILGFTVSLNLPLPIVACFYQQNGKFTYLGRYFSIYPLWDYINLGVYNCAPFILMVIFNSGVIYSLIRHRRTITLQNSRVQHRSISMTLVITTFLFLLMTIPATVAFAFFSNIASGTILDAMDSILYTYHITSFPLYFITFGDFRREFIAMITCSTNNPRVAPVPVIVNNRTPGYTLSTNKYAGTKSKRLDSNPIG